MSWGARSAPLREPKKTNALGAAKSNEEKERRKDSHRGQMRRKDSHRGQMRRRKDSHRGQMRRRNRDKGTDEEKEERQGDR